MKQKLLSAIIPNLQPQKEIDNCQILTSKSSSSRIKSNVSEWGPSMGKTMCSIDEEREFCPLFQLKTISPQQQRLRTKLIEQKQLQKDIALSQAKLSPQQHSGALYQTRSLRVRRKGEESLRPLKLQTNLNMQVADLVQGFQIKSPKALSKAKNPQSVGTLRNPQAQIAPQNKAQIQSKLKALAHNFNLKQQLKRKEGQKLCSLVSSPVNRQPLSSDFQMNPVSTQLLSESGKGKFMSVKLRENFLREWGESMVQNQPQTAYIHHTPVARLRQSLKVKDPNQEFVNKQPNELDWRKSLQSVVKKNNKYFQTVHPSYQVWQSPASPFGSHCDTHQPFQKGNQQHQQTTLTQKSSQSNIGLGVSGLRRQKPTALEDSSVNEFQELCNDI